MNNKIKFGIIGSGWRAECFIQTALQLPDYFTIAGVISRRKERREELNQKWKIPVYSSLDDLVSKTEPDFMVAAVSKDSGSFIIKECADKKIPLLAETPPALTLSGLIKLYQSINKNSQIQIAEQYHLQPMHAARLAIIHSDQLGEVKYCQVSISHGYHGISLIRKYLNKKFENAIISAHHFKMPGIPGPGRKGLADKEEVKDNMLTLATIDFGDKLGLYDFEVNQHRSFIRSQRILIRGIRGEIENQNVKYLIDYKTPGEYKMKRNQTGINENLEGFYLKGITSGSKWLYKNPYLQARLSDEEIALATALMKMNDYIKKGKSFYSLAEACQDHYLSLMIEESLSREESIQTSTQIWGI